MLLSIGTLHNTLFQSVFDGGPLFLEGSGSSVVGLLSRRSILLVLLSFFRTAQRE